MPTLALGSVEVGSDEPGFRHQWRVPSLWTAFPYAEGIASLPRLPCLGLLQNPGHMTQHTTQRAQEKASSGRVPAALLGLRVRKQSVGPPDLPLGAYLPGLLSWITTGWML